MISFMSRPIFYLRNKLSERHFIILSSILVGLTSGGAAILLKYMVHHIEQVVADSRRTEDFFVFAIFPLLGILLTVFFIRFFLNNTLKKGSAEIVYSIVKKSSILPARDMFGHLITSAFTVGFGGSLGLESPMVSTGSAIGSNYGHANRLTYRERTVLLGCGASAGIAAAFNSPIAGVLFAVEVLLTEVTASAFIPLIISAACGALLSKIVLAEGVTLAFSLKQPFDYKNVPYYVVLGILCGLISLCYAKVFHGIESRIGKVSNQWVRAIIGGLLLFGIISVFPPLFGEGYDSVRALESKNALMLTEGSFLGGLIDSEGMLLVFIGALIIFKMIAAALTIGSGGNGGSFAPSLVVGSYLGFLFSRLMNLSGLTQLPVSNFTLVAMAGILSGVFYAPLTAIFLIAEITGGYHLIIPLMLVSSLSLTVVHFFEPLSMEAKKLSKMLHSTVETRDKLLLSRLDLSELIERNFSVVPEEARLSDLVKIIASSNRNLFPVVDKGQKLIGLIHMDRVRGIMFDNSKYDVINVRELMTKPEAVVELDENLHEVFAKFDSTHQWNLPVIEDGIYLGFLSKSSILNRYRNELIES
ncbi:chloride channel protein [Chryseolinea lacunae]|uniref:Chloride channel protein n=1 Tax=Chryseolinea lacunae TaxID=2801331 RepID=A0ABS1KXQ4_9BACT|nr:chloride channel protein [Chryseolinea lacunae]MBL0744154.1 chloride channel protein [Chryseolinea lacunae]